MKPFGNTTGAETATLGDDLLHGAEAIAVFVFGNETQALLIARLDNLGKGASGAAVQCMNVHLGLDEGLGL